GLLIGGSSLRHTAWLIFQRGLWAIRQKSGHGAPSERGERIIVNWCGHGFEHLAWPAGDERWRLIVFLGEAPQGGSWSMRPRGRGRGRGPRRHRRHGSWSVSEGLLSCGLLGIPARDRNRTVFVGTPDYSPLGM